MAAIFKQTLGAGLPAISTLAGRTFGQQPPRYLCVLFYNYLADYLSRMRGVKRRLVQADRGDARCTYQVKPC